MPSPSAEIRFGLIGRWVESPPLEPWTFMVLSPTQYDPPLTKKYIADVLILDGWVLFRGVRQGVGSIGPVSLDRKEIEWLE